MSRPEHSPQSESTALQKQEADEPGGATHPDGAFEYGVVALAVVIVAVSLYLSLKYLFAPGEKGTSHIKRTILEEES